MFTVLSYSLFVNSEVLGFDIQNHCYEVSPEQQILTSNVVELGCYQKLMGEEIDCSVLRNYRDENGNWVCPTVDYDACLKKYGPRLPPSYFQFVKNWCYCNCIYDPEE